jgi:Ser/Thr protein kinase RdoA (MazF antagonist)
MRIIHGDPKINNVMVDSQTGKAVSIIDLDTIKPGLLLYDLGDCLRSCCNISGEESDDFDAVRFDLGRCEALLSGYMGAAHEGLTARDFDFFFDAIRLIPFELGLRFYTDYLGGNLYFKISHPAQNLDRAMVQFRLVESIEQQEAEIRAIIEKYRFG